MKKTVLKIFHRSFSLARCNVLKSHEDKLLPPGSAKLLRWLEQLKTREGGALKLLPNEGFKATLKDFVQHKPITALIQHYNRELEEQSSPESEFDPEKGVKT